MEDGKKLVLGSVFACILLVAAIALVAFLAEARPMGSLLLVRHSEFASEPSHSGSQALRRISMPDSEDAGPSAPGNSAIKALAATGDNRLEQIKRLPEVRDVEIIDDEVHSIALQVAWETVANTVSVSKAGGALRPDRQKLGWFLEYVQDRTRVSPPDWWKEAVLDARANSRSNIYPGKTTLVPYHRTNIYSIECPRNASLERNGNSIVYQVNRDRTTIPEELFDRGRKSFCNISGCFTEEHLFVTVHSSAGFPHDIACVDRLHEKVVWKSSVCGCWEGMAMGYHQSWVSYVVTDDNRIFVFGMASIGFYLHGFRASDGRSLIHFSSNDDSSHLDAEATAPESLRR